MASSELEVPNKPLWVGKQWYKSCYAGDLCRLIYPVPLGHMELCIHMTLQLLDGRVSVLLFSVDTLRLVEFYCNLV